MEKIKIERTDEIVYHHKLDCGLNIYIWECKESSDINLLFLLLGAHVIKVISLFPLVF